MAELRLAEGTGDYEDGCKILVWIIRWMDGRTLKMELINPR